MKDDGEIVEWPTLLLLAATYAAWVVGTLSWQDSAILSLVLTAWAIAQFSSLQHEALHGHPFRNPALNEALVFVSLSLFVPFRRFRDTHLQHHFDPALTDPYDDPESNYLDPSVWERQSRLMQRIQRWNNTLAGRMIIGPLLGTWRFMADDLAQLRHDPRIAPAWIAHGLGLVPVVLWLVLVGDMPIWAYLVAVYLAFALLRIRTFLEHRAHETPRGRTVVIEDRGPLALLFLNNNFHVVHHMHPSVPWYRLPALYAKRRDHFLRRNDGYLYSSYGQIFARYLWRAKDTVPHPIWPVQRPGLPPEEEAG